MAEVIKKARNHWAKGIVMDFSPENTKNDTLTYALNATLLTFNGNELSLQNDMGNARVETAYLPEGYMPVGTCEYGGIIYIVSYNPLEDKSLIGCFPSPERNISSDELGISNVNITEDFFQGENGEIKLTSQCVMLKNDPLNPGDKFIITSDNNIYNNKLKDLLKENTLIDNPIISLNIVSIEDSGKITYLNSEVRQYQVGKYSYSILGGTKDVNNNETAPDLDAYRNAVSSGYNVFKSKTSGRLAILAELIMIDSYNVTHSLLPAKNDEGNIIEGKFDIILHTEVSPELNSSNYSQAPKLKYYYLQNSLGYILTYNSTISLFNEEGEKDESLNISLKDIYTYQNDENSIFLEKYLTKDNFDFPNAFTYHKNDNDYLPVEYKHEDNDELPVEYKYEDIKLGSIQIPEKVVDYGLDLPFKYDYTIVPCMEYGKLEHLAVSNTIDFSKLHAFNLSNFHTWKYFIENNHLKLTFGVDVYDTYEQHKVDGIFLEFYDLWGFAGSLEITDKKSYNGIFTKVIPLNSLNVLSTKKISGNSQIDTYNRNINIIKLNNKYYFKNKEVKHDINQGWRYITSSDKSLGKDNDCGTLYSNIIYGVKVYLKRSTNSNNKYVHKDNFLLLTLPIYNEYYHTVKNFNNITNPKLLFLLTYKLQDSSNRLEYTGNDITNGYNAEDLKNINNYLEGNCKEVSLDVIKYYKYSGTSRLYLEIGLLKDYENLNLYSDLELNKYYNCKLLLCSNDDPTTTFTISSNNSEIFNSEEILNYNGNTFDNNLLRFDSGSTKELPNIRNHNFISNDNPEAILIDYKFIIGYKAFVSDIVETQVPTTTMCALFHQNQNEYNYSDFGMYKNGNDILYKTMFYNSGTSTKEEFGLCTLNTTTGTLLEQCSSIVTTGDDALEIKEQFKFNSGSNLKELYSYIGKLTFCLPHVHGLSNGGSNLEISNNGKFLGIAIDLGNWKIHGDGHDDAYGTFPTKCLYNNPQYNLSFNTLNSIKYNSEFISAIDYYESEVGISGWDQNDNVGNAYLENGTGDHRSNPIKTRIYTGFTGEEVAKFNSKLLKTMSSIYAYNPDYDLLNVNAGTVSVLDYSPIFTSNIINSKSEFKLNNETLNDYIYLNGIKISDYLSYLNEYSGTTIGNDLIFEPDFTYCGTETSPYLITTLTYKSDVPSELIKDLTFDTSERVLVKHFDGKVDYIQGSPNKRALYGYDDINNNLIQLDVSNYTINRDTGALELVDLKSLGFKYYNSTIFTNPDHGKNNIFEVAGLLITTDIQINPVESGNYFYPVYSSNKITINITKGKEFTFKITTDSDDIYGFIVARLNKDADINRSRTIVRANSNILFMIGVTYTIGFIDNVLEEINSLDINILKFVFLKEVRNQFIFNDVTLKYSNFENHKYIINNNYENACIADTSITLNDLVYEPNIDGHRLFMKNNLFIYDAYLRGKIYYRQLPLGWDDRYDVSKYKNNIFMATGPSFTKNWKSYYEINTTQETIL